MKKAIIAIMTIIIRASCANEGILSVREINQQPEQAIAFNIFTDKATHS